MQTVRALGAEPLAALVERELSRTPPEAAVRLADEIAQRLGPATAAVLFYGSCLRRGTSEGVLDFYALVDDYAAAYRSRALRWANAVLPPNVFYLEIGSPLGPLRCKYAVVSLDDFERGARPGGIRSSLWARFCQPALAVRWREDARQRVVAAVAQSVVTAVSRVLPSLRDERGVARFDAETLWLGVLNETYASEWRAEAPEAIRTLYDADPDRYREAAGAALDELARRGWTVARNAEPFEVRGVAESPGRPRRTLHRAAAKAVYFAGLLKSAATFGDWLPYALWKLERHTGAHIELTERQRRHPFIWGWPVLARVLRKRHLR